MEADYTILPANTLTTMVTQLFAVIADNVLVIVGVVALAVGIRFVTRWFSKATSKVKA